MDEEREIEQLKARVSNLETMVLLLCKHTENPDCRLAGHEALEKLKDSKVQVSYYIRWVPEL